MAQPGGVELPGDTGPLPPPMAQAKSRWIPVRWAELPGFRGETQIDVPSGGVVQAVLRVDAMAQVRFRTSGPCPRPNVYLRTAGPEGKWGGWAGYGGREGKVLDTTQNALPGVLRWQVKFRVKGELPDKGAPDAEGEVATRVGEIADVEIPVPAR